jgi:glycosyltransferase involved in cell wall biosynthesis
MIAPAMPVGPLRVADASAPSVALIVLAFNHARYLPQLFASIDANRAEIRELLFIDNGSSDDSARQMQAYLQARRRDVIARMFVNKRGTSVPTAVNEALRAATSEFIAVTAADDYLLERRFAGQLALLRSDASIQFCYSNGYVCDDSGTLSMVPVHGPATVEMLTRSAAEIADKLFYPVPALFTQCALFRRAALLKIDGWDEDLIIDDWPLNLKLFRRFPDGYRFLDGFVCAYRRHSTNASKRRYRQYVGQKQVLLKYAHGKNLQRALFAMFASQALTSLKRRQWNRARVFLHAAFDRKPGTRFLLQYIMYEISHRLAADRIR